MRKRKRVFGMIVFLAIGLMMTVMVSYVLRPVDDNFHRNVIAGFYAEEEDSLDVVGIGSSALYCFLNSPAMYEYTGITSYPLCTVGQQIYVIENLIDEVLKTQSPQLLVVESRKFLSSKTKIKMNRLRMVTDNMDYSANRISLINKLVDGWGKRLPFYFDVMLYHENWENMTMDSFSYFLNRKPHPLKGWLYLGRHRTLEKPDISNVTGELPIAEESEKVLLSVMEKCREKNLEILFVLSPFQIDEELQMKANYMKRIVEEQGFRFLDCNRCADEMGLDFGVDFFDKRHTNAIGADKFSKYLGEYILKNYDIETEHSPLVAASWDKAVEENHVLYEKARENIYQKILEKGSAALVETEAESEG